MAQCRHTHATASADKWTKIAMAGEGVASFVSDGYWLGGLVDLAFQLDDAGYGLSWYGIGFGAAISLIIAVGTTYSHGMLNLNHQHHHSAPDEEKGLLANDVLAEQEQVQAAEPEHAHAHAHAQHNANKAADGKLGALQKAALVGDFISHVGDIAGPITFIAKIATKETLPTWGKALVECGATLFGGVASIANVRTCANSMRNLNRLANRELHDRAADQVVVAAVSAPR